MRVDLGAIDVDDALAGGADAGRALKAVKEYVRAIPDHGIGFGMLRYLSGESDPLGRFRSPQISFNYLAGSAPLTEHRTGCRWRAIEGLAEPRTRPCLWRP